MVAFAISDGSIKTRRPTFISTGPSPWLFIFQYMAGEKLFALQNSAIVKARNGNGSIFRRRERFRFDAACILGEHARFGFCIRRLHRWGFDYTAGDGP
jgi:hypothetical protein